MRKAYVGALPLNESALSDKTENGIRVREFYFDGFATVDGRVRAYIKLYESPNEPAAAKRVVGRDKFAFAAAVACGERLRVQRKPGGNFRFADCVAITSPNNLWRDYDVGALPLNESALSDKTENGHNLLFA